MWQSIEGPVRAVFTIGTFIFFQTIYISDQGYHFLGNFVKSSFFELWLFACYSFSLLMCLQYLTALVASFFEYSEVVKQKLTIARYDEIVDQWSKLFLMLLLIAIITAFVTSFFIDINW